MSDETNDPRISRRSRVVGQPSGDGNSAAAASSTEVEGDDEDGLEGSDELDGGERGSGFLQNLWGGIKEIVIIAVMAMVLSFVVKSWLIQAFYIPSGSMEDTLVKDDRVIVSKLTPGPFDLAHGDVVVFKDPANWLGDASTVQDQPGLRGAVHKGLQFVGLLPDDSNNHLIKRVIGLPGDHVVCCDTAGATTVNGAPITETYVKQGDTPSGGRAPFDITVPAGRVWVMGDHRSDSSDSRFHDDGTGATGSVPIDDITGRAVMIVWPIDNVKWLSVPSRIYSTVPAPGPSSTTPVGPSSDTTPKAG